MFMKHLARPDARLPCYAQYFMTRSQRERITESRARQTAENSQRLRRRRNTSVTPSTTIRLPVLNGPASQQPPSSWPLELPLPLPASPPLPLQLFGTSAGNGVFVIPVTATLSIVQPPAPCASALPFRKRSWKVMPARCVPKSSVTESVEGIAGFLMVIAWRPPIGLCNIVSIAAV